MVSHYAECADQILTLLRTREASTIAIPARPDEFSALSKIDEK